MTKIGLDFDGVIHSYTSGFKGHGVIPDPPVPGAIKYLLDLLDEPGVAVYIISTRAEKPEGKSAIDDEVAKVVGEQNVSDALKKLHITNEKVGVRVLLDDRAMQFTGVFPPKEALVNYTPWTGKQPHIESVGH